MARVLAAEDGKKRAARDEVANRTEPGAKQHHGHNPTIQGSGA